MLHWQNNKHPVWQAGIRSVRLVAISALLATCNQDKLGTPFSAHQTAAQQATESFTPEKKIHDKLDILLVIDESGSMNETHRTLSSRLDDLLTAVKESDWQIAITTTNPMSCVLTVIDKHTPKYKQIFTETINQKTLQDSYQDYSLYLQSNHEQAFYGAIRGLRGDCIVARSLDDKNIEGVISEAALNESIGGYNSSCQKKKTWIRDESMLAILLITDEDHQCLNSYGCHITDFYFYLKSIRTPHSTGRVYGLLDTERQGQHEPKGADRFLAWKDNNGESLFDFYDSVFNQDYSSMLTKISQNLAAALKNNFNLQHRHDGGKTSVTITTADGETQTLKEGQYNVEGNALSINITLPANTKEIKVTYTH